MTAERRLAKLEGALSPKAATLLWLAEAHEFRSLPAYVDWLIDQPISAAPLERVPEQARAAAVEAMRGQPREVVREAAHHAVRDAIFLVELVLKLSVAAEETIRIEGLRYAALFWEMRAISAEAQLETARGLRSTSRRPTARRAAWHEAVVSLIGNLYAAEETRAHLGTRSSSARPPSSPISLPTGRRWASRPSDWLALAMSSARRPRGLTQGATGKAHRRAEQRSTCASCVPRHWIARPRRRRPW